MSRATAIDVAKELGNTLVAPVLPIDVGATGVSEATATPGGITVSAEVFKSLKLAEIESMVWNGFKNIFVMGDHGGGQEQVVGHERLGGQHIPVLVDLLAAHLEKARHVTDLGRLVQGVDGDVAGGGRPAQVVTIHAVLGARVGTEGAFPDGVARGCGTP